MARSNLRYQALTQEDIDINGYLVALQAQAYLDLPVHNPEAGHTNLRLHKFGQAIFNACTSENLFQVLGPLVYLVPGVSWPSLLALGQERVDGGQTTNGH